MTLTAGVDIGGTKIAGGLVDEAGRIAAGAVLDTPSLSVDDLLDTVCRLVEQLRGARADVVAVGVGAAGFVDARRERMRFAPNLAWTDLPVRDLLQERIGLPVTVENDANAAAWAEHRFGAGRGEAHLLAVTVGTGIGGGAVLDGRLYRGRFGMAGEFGHVRVVPDGLPCGCGNRGCWEQYCSGPALQRAAERRLGPGAPGSGPQVTAAALAGDPVAIDCFTEIGGWLGQGLADLAAVFDPGAFVVGGGVSQAGELLLGPARERYAAALTGRGHRPLADIRLAQLGPQAGLVGAADLARREVSGCAC